jgi:hypothetical protein
MTRAGFEYILRKHVRTATERRPSLAAKRVSPHVLRYTAALVTLQATKDLRKVSLWLGHANMQTTEIYTRVDPSVKLEVLESIVAPKLRSGRFKATDKLIASLRPKTLCGANSHKRSRKAGSQWTRLCITICGALQLPVDTWHAYLGEPTLADAILDRLVHHSHRIELKVPGESMRKLRAPVDA